MELTAADHAHFRDRGWVRLPGAFSGDAAAAMRDVAWRALEKRGVDRDDPSTWTEEAPFHLQGLKSAPVFKAIGSARTLGAITEVLGADVRVVEMTGQAGDVILMHPLLLHTRPTNAGSQPRFLVNKDLRVSGPGRI